MMHIDSVIYDTRYTYLTAASGTGDRREPRLFGDDIGEVLLEYICRIRPFPGRGVLPALVHSFLKLTLSNALVGLPYAGLRLSRKQKYRAVTR